MIKLIMEEKPENERTRMGDMKPLEFAKIDDPTALANNHIVMRTASKEKFEVIDLSDPGPDECWLEFERWSPPFVRLIEPGTRFIIEVL